MTTLGIPQGKMSIKNAYQRITFQLIVMIKIVNMNKGDNFDDDEKGIHVL